MTKSNLIFACVSLITIVGYNIFLIHRDQQLFSAYDTVCAQSVHPNCYFSK